MSHEHSPLPWVVTDSVDIRDTDEGRPDNLVAETRGGKVLAPGHGFNSERSKQSETGGRP